MVEKKKKKEWLSMEGREQELAEKGHKTTFWVEIRIYTLIGVWITRMHVFIKTHRMAHLAFMHFSKKKQYWTLENDRNAECPGWGILMSATYYEMCEKSKMDRWMARGEMKQAEQMSMEEPE